MIIAESLTERKAEKKRIKREMAEYLIKFKDVAAKSPYNKNTTSAALNPDKKYWNDKIVALAKEMIEEKRNQKNAASLLALSKAL